GACVTLMGLLALPAMLKAGYNVKVSAGTITAGGCLGILIPPSVLLIVYGAVAGVSVVQLYAGAFLPGFMLARLYICYVIVLAELRPGLMPPLCASEPPGPPLPPRLLPLTRYGSHALAGLWGALTARGSDGTVKRTAFSNLLVSVVPVLAIVAILDITYRWVTTPDVEASTAGLVQAGGEVAADVKEDTTGGLQEPEEEKTEGQAKPVEGLQPPPAANAEPGKPETTTALPASADQPAGKVAEAPVAKVATGARLPMPQWFWLLIAVAVAAIGLIYWLWNWERLEVFKMLLASFFPLALLILAVLG